MRPASLFLTPSGLPLCTSHAVFYLDPRTPASLSSSILAYGGQLSPLLTSSSIHLLPFPPKTLIPDKLSHKVFSADFIGDSVKLMELLPLEMYKLRTKVRMTEKRNAYSYEEDLKMWQYVKTHADSGQHNVSYWKKAKEALGFHHSADSLRCHYRKFTEKMKMEGVKTRKKWTEVDNTDCIKTEIGGERSAGAEGSLVKISVWPNNTVSIPDLKRLKNDSFSPRKSIKTDPDSPKPVHPPTPPREEDPVLSSFSQLSIVSTPAPPDDNEDYTETLQKFKKLASKCRELANSQTSDREILRVLIDLFHGDVSAILAFYLPR